MSLLVNVQPEIINIWTNQFVRSYLPRVDQLLHGGIFNESLMTISIMNEIHLEDPITVTQLLNRTLIRKWFFNDITVSEAMHINSLWLRFVELQTYTKL